MPLQMQRQMQSRRNSNRASRVTALFLQKKHLSLLHCQPASNSPSGRIDEYAVLELEVILESVSNNFLHSSIDRLAVSGTLYHVNSQAIQEMIAYSQNTPVVDMAGNKVSPSIALKG